MGKVRLRTLKQCTWDLWAACLLVAGPPATASIPAYILAQVLLNPERLEPPRDSEGFSEQGIRQGDPQLCKHSCQREKSLPTGCKLNNDLILPVFMFQKIMKRLIKRYVLKAQVDRENDEVNGSEAILGSASWR